MTRPTPRMDSPIQEESCPHEASDSREAGCGIVMLGSLHTKVSGQPGLSVAQIVDLLTEFNLRAVGVTGDDFGERAMGAV